MHCGRPNVSALGGLSCRYLIGAVCVGDSGKRLQGRGDGVRQDEGTRGRTVLLRLSQERQEIELHPSAVQTATILLPPSRGSRGHYSHSMDQWRGNVRPHDGARVNKPFNNHPVENMNFHWTRPLVDVTLDK